MNYACPISDRLVNETVVRLVALLVFIATVLGCFAFLPWVGAVLALDFFIRAFTKLPISYISLLANLIAKILRLSPKPINAGPKVFAARLGFAFAVAMSVLGFLHFTVAAIIVAGALAACAALEAFFSVCVGCHLYSILSGLRSSSKTSGDDVQ